MFQISMFDKGSSKAPLSKVIASTSEISLEHLQSILKHLHEALSKAVIHNVFSKTVGPLKPVYKPLRPSGMPQYTSETR